MSQVGHADSKMTMDVYAQLQQRVDREHGRAFDALVRQRASRLYGADEGSNRAVDWQWNWAVARMWPIPTSPKTPSPKQAKRPC